MLVEKALKERVELLPSDLAHFLFGETLVVHVANVDVWPVLGYKFEDSQPFGLKIRTPLILTLELPLGFNVVRVPKLAVSFDRVLHRPDC